MFNVGCCVSACVLQHRAFISQPSKSPRQCINFELGVRGSENVCCVFCKRAFVSQIPESVMGMLRVMCDFIERIGLVVFIVVLCVSHMCGDVSQWGFGILEV